MYNESCDAIGLKKISQFPRVAFSISAEHLRIKVEEASKVMFELDVANDSNSTIILNFWCHNPGLGLKTLFEKEEHIIEPSPVFINIVSRGIDNVLFDATYQNRYSHTLMIF